MRVGILTYHFSENFGGAIQAYALRKWFLERGVDAELINYHPSHVEGGSIELRRGPRAFAKSLFLLVSQLRQRFVGNREQAEAFRRFVHEESGVIGTRLHNAADFRELRLPDLVVCGSDQIWNPSTQFGLDPVYFAQFPGSESVRRISYAASFGKDSLEDTYHDEAARLLKGLDAIGVRETSGLEIVRRLTDQTPIKVADPTILLRDFSTLISKNPVSEAGHLFCYALRTGEVAREVADSVSREHNLKIISPNNPHRRWREIGRTVYPSPGEWVTLIASSAFVVTNSFHGVALSILLSKPFIAAALPGRRNGLNVRVRDLLDATGLSDRMIEPGELNRAASLSAQPIDWTQVALRLDALQNYSASFLDAQLSQVER